MEEKVIVFVLENSDIKRLLLKPGQVQWERCAVAPQLFFGLSFLEDAFSQQSIFFIFAAGSFSQQEASVF